MKKKLLALLMGMSLLFTPMTALAGSSDGEENFDRTEVEIGETYEWTLEDATYFDDATFSGDYTFKINKVTAIEPKNVKRYGYKVESDYDYYMVNATWTMENGSFESDNKNENYYATSIITPQFRYVTNDEVEIFSVGHSGFKNSFTTNAETTLKKAFKQTKEYTAKLKPGMKNFKTKVTGDIFVAVPAGDVEKSFLVIKDESYEDSSTGDIFFRLSK